MGALDSSRALGRLLKLGAALTMAGVSVAGCSGDDEVVGEADEAVRAGCSGVTSGNLEFEDDACKKKRYPTDRTRAVSCPIVSYNASGFAPSSEPPVLDPLALKGVVPDDLKVTVILIRRVNGVPVYRYLSNGTFDAQFQPWSSTKFLAVAAAAARIRARSQGKVGLTANTGDIPLGDLVTVITSYREDRYSSNGLARYFLNIAGRDAALALPHKWLDRPTESYGGNYGVAAPPLEYTFRESTGESGAVEKDEGSGIPNRMSTFSMAEALKRLAVWDDAATRLPDVQAEDLEVLFYGPQASRWYPEQWGGMSADLGIYVQSALDMATVERESRGRWRIFGKLGSGDGDLVENQYTCLPVLDDKGMPIADRGAEFVISTRLSRSAGARVASDQAVAQAYRDAIAKVILPRAQTPGNAPVAAGAADAGVAAADGGPAASKKRRSSGAAAADGEILEEEPTASDESDPRAGCSVAPRRSLQSASWAPLGLAAAVAGLLARRRRAVPTR